MSTPSESLFYMPPEWHPHECCWMQWPTESFPTNATPSWSHFDLDKGRIAWANVANSISKFEKLLMIVNPSDLKSATKLLNSNIEKTIPKYFNILFFMINYLKSNFKSY